MDRLKVTLTACGLAALLIGPGCRNLRPEVPPGPPYSSDGRQMPAVGFSSDAHAPNAAASLGQPGMPANPAGSSGQLGIPAPGSNLNGIPTVGAYGQPGTSGGMTAPAVREGDAYSPNGALGAAGMSPAGGAPAMGGAGMSGPGASGLGMPPR